MLSELADHLLSGSDILSEQVISAITPPLTDNNKFIADLDRSWSAEYTISGGVVDIYINAIKIK